VELLWGAVTGLWTSTWNGVKTDLGTAWTKITTWAKGWWDDAVKAVKKIWDAVSGAWTGKWGATKTDLEHKWNEIKNWVTHAWDSAVGSVKKIWDSVSGAWTNKWNEIKAVFTGKDGIVTWIEDHFVKAALQWGKNMVQNLADGIKNAPKNALKAI